MSKDPLSSDPPGFLRTKYESPAITDIFLLGGSVGSGQDVDTLKRATEARALDLAKAQFPALLQTAFMMWMFIGNQLNLYSIFFLLSMGTTPIKNLMNVHGAFAQLTAHGADLTMAKMLYGAINLAGTGVFLYKLRSMGLLPITSSDWVSLLPTRTPVEHSSLGMPLE